MLKTIQAVVEKDGSVRLLEKVQLEHASRALVTILDREDILNSLESSLVSEQSLAVDWNRPEEDEAWKHFQREK